MDIDVTDILTDPTVAADTFDVVRRQETVGSNGFATLAPTTTTALRGAVFPSGDNSLVRQEAFTNQQQSLTVVTTFRLRGAGVDGAGNKFQPDLIVWPSGSGNQYIVQSVKDWSRYGPGFIEAEVASYDLTARVPT